MFNSDVNVTARLRELSNLDSKAELEKAGQRLLWDLQPLTESSSKDLSESIILFLNISENTIEVKSCC